MTIRHDRLRQRLPDHGFEVTDAVDHGLMCSIPQTELVDEPTDLYTTA